jgi:hypothetical protein
LTSQDPAGACAGFNLIDRCNNYVVEGRNDIEYFAGNTVLFRYRVGVAGSEFGLGLAGSDASLAGGGEEDLPS